MKSCPIKGCLRVIPEDRAMCRMHWFQVPKVLRDQINRAHQAKDSIRWGRAMLDAKQIITQELQAR